MAGDGFGTLQRLYDAYCDRHDLPRADARGVKKADIDAMLADEAQIAATHVALQETLDRFSVVTDAVLVVSGKSELSPMLDLLSPDQVVDFYNAYERVYRATFGAVYERALAGEFPAPEPLVGAMQALVGMVREKEDPWAGRLLHSIMTNVALTVESIDQRDQEEEKAALKDCWRRAVIDVFARSEVA